MTNYLQKNNLKYLKSCWILLILISILLITVPFILLCVILGDDIFYTSNIKFIRIQDSFNVRIGDTGYSLISERTVKEDYIILKLTDSKNNEYKELKIEFSPSKSNPLYYAIYKYQNYNFLFIEYDLGEYGMSFDLFMITKEGIYMPFATDRSTARFDGIIDWYTTKSCKFPRIDGLKITSYGKHRCDPFDASIFDIFFGLNKEEIIIDVNNKSKKIEPLLK